MTKKISLLFSAYAVALILSVVSCGIDECGPFPDSYKVVELDWELYEAYFLDTANGSLSLVELTENSVIYSKYGIVITSISEDYYTMAESPKNSNWMNAAYACSPPEPTTTEYIENIEIISDQDFDENHKAGVNLSDLFDAVYYGGIPGKTRLLDLNEFVSTSPKLPYPLTLILKSPPTTTSAFEFTVKYYQYGIDMDYFEFQTNKVEIRTE